MLHEPEHSPIRLHPLFRPARRRRAHVAQAKWFPAAVVVLLLTARRMALMGPLATGLDGGEWLAIGRGLLGGPQRSTGGAYPPLVPIATMLAANVFGDLTAVRLMAMVSCLALLGAIAGVTLSELGPWVGALVVAVIGSASAVVEPMAFGGYPQQFALAGMVLATWGTSAWLLTGRLAALAVAAVSLSFVALTHHVYVLLAFAAAGIAWGAWAAAGQHPETLLRRSWPLATAAGVAAILAAPTLRAFLDAGYTPPLGAVFDLAAAWRYSVREAMPLWTLIAGLGLLSASMLLVAGKATPLALTAFGLAAAGLFAFVPFAEPRSAPPLVAGAVFGVALGWRTLPRPKPRLMLAASAIAATLL
ncbi:MAG: hypothetical protein IT337_02380, partial [Thermomicrobiales bacterium]|nr:hypothetical protein [Thermomicrobiales bacterium]